MKNSASIIALATASVLFLSTTESLAATWIDGYKYPDGCQKVARLVDGVRYMGIQCPRSGVDTRVERAKRADPPSFGGFSSSNVKPQPLPQLPVRCQAAETRMGKNLAHFLNWIRVIKYGMPEQRVLTTTAAHVIGKRLRSWSMRVMDHGLSIFRHRRRGEDGDGLCEAYIDKGNVELTRVITLIKAEAARGNRDLTDTGLNPHESVYNN